MITYAARDDILTDTRNEYAILPDARRIQLSGDRAESRYGVIRDGAAAGVLVRVDYVAESAKPGISRVRIEFSRDDSRADNYVTFGNSGHLMGRTNSNAMGVQAPGQCDCGSFHCAH